MAGMRGVNCFLVARYIVFGLFTICNAITCSIAVWNSSLVNVRSAQLFQVDVYLIFLGAFSLLSIFTLNFIELLCTSAVTTRVWFECAWVTLFWIMELAGGAALIAIESEMPCSRQTSIFLNTLCASERVLLAFTWICSIMLLVYLLALVFVAVSQPGVPKIWDTDVRVLHAGTLRQYPSSISTSPLDARFNSRGSVDIYIPQPVCSQPRPFHHRGGRGIEYEIEPYRPMLVGPEQMDAPYSSNLPEAIPLPPSAAVSVPPSFAKRNLVLPRDTGNARSLPTSRFDPPQGLASTIVYARSASLLSGPVAGPSSTLPSPSPLGDWPRHDVMQLPVKPKAKRRSPSPSGFPIMHTADRASVPADMDRTVTQPRSRRPSGPRLRMPSLESGHRPPRLDLSGISNYETGRRDS